MNLPAQVESATFISTRILILVSLLYFFLLLAVAYYANWRRRQGTSLQKCPYIYALSMAVYCTSWTFYGSVGNAASSGLEFLPIYLGPTLIAFASYFILRKVIRISKERNITSIADFLSSRYDRSTALGAIVTLFAVFGISPYIALQLKAIAETLNILSIPAAINLFDGVRLPALNIAPQFDIALIAALLLAFFCILFGAKSLDSAEQHEGLVVVVAFESLVKLIAFVAVGLFITYGVFNGFSDVFTRFYDQFPEKRDLFTLGTEQTPYIKWFSLLVISMMAVMFLPRQFHIMVTENSNEDHIKTAMWSFPAYLFLINLFVLPIAMAGLIYSGGDPLQADYYALSLPLLFGQKALAVLVFVGGLSAAAGMVMISSITMATMLLNHLMMPLILKLKLPLQNYSRLLIYLKQLNILAIIMFGYLFYRAIGSSFALVNIGLISFMAAIQFAPAFIGGLFWRRASLKAALAGICGGFLIWFYTLLIPALVRSGWIDETIVEQGLFGIWLLKPLELFGLHGFDIYSHCLFWSLFFNLGTFIFISFTTHQSEEEHSHASGFIDTLIAQPQEPQQLKRINKAPTVMEFVELMSKFIGEKSAQNAISGYLGQKAIDFSGRLLDAEIPQLKTFTERTLAGYVGAAPARIILENYLSARGSEMENVFDIFGTVTISHAAGREQLSVLYEVAQIVSKGVNLQKIFASILELLRQQFKFDLVVIRMVEDESQTLQVKCMAGEASTNFGQNQGGLNRNSYIGEAFLTNTTMVVNDIDYTENHSSVQVIRDEGISCFAHSPVIMEGEAVGVLSAFSKTTKGIFTPEFIALFENIAAQVAIAWRNDRQLHQLLEARKQERDLEIAKQIQSSLLPANLPQTQEITVAGLCVPTHQVGGDYYDFIIRGEDSYDLIVADVSGHNIGSALIMTETRTFIHAQLDTIDSPGAMLKALNAYAFNDLDRTELFVTMFYLKYHRINRRLTYSNAGHNSPLIWHRQRNECEVLDADGLIFGVRESENYEEKSTTLEAGDMLLLYTDGIIEAENPDTELFGMERLTKLLDTGKELTPQELIDYIMEQVRIFTGKRHFSDDVTLLAMKILE
jgi:Na+/proline symporter/serine phosphatase RsbU (regulator of sigma subunit)